MIGFWIIVGIGLILLGLWIFSQGGQNFGPFISTIGLVILLVLLVSPARGHDWYDRDCCSNNDCKPIASCSEITEHLNGGAKWDKYVFQKKNVRPSHDSKCHVCIQPSSDSPMCVYTQQGS